MLDSKAQPGTIENFLPFRLNWKYNCVAIVKNFIFQDCFNLKTDSKLTFNSYVCNKEGLWSDPLQRQGPGLCEKLVNEGTDINATDANGRTALIEAAWGGHNELVKFLIERRLM